LDAGAPLDGAEADAPGAAARRDVLDGAVSADCGCVLPCGSAKVTPAQMGIDATAAAAARCRVDRIMKQDLSNLQATHGQVAIGEVSSGVRGAFRHL